jgi:endonuclease/exonuclease/phosphatase family metal-dependent hydrolase
VVSTLRCARTIVLFAAAAQAGGAPAGWMADQSPELPDYTDLIMLSGHEWPGAAAERKLQDVLETPVVSNAAARSGTQPKRPAGQAGGRVLRFAQWNLEDGHNFDLIRSALNGPAELLKNATDAQKRTAAGWQAAILGGADVVMLNEADLGVSRSGYRDVAAELASELRMNYAFGVEFVEVDPHLLGLQASHAPGHPSRKTRFRGLQGNAVLSRYPILNAKVLRLPECHDWYGGEKQAIADLEKGRRWTVERVFEERISREIRRGGRIALIVDLSVPDAPGGVVTVVSTHLENRCDPACRQEQMNAILKAIAGISHPVVIGGDLNTSGMNAAPTSVTRELSGRAKSLKFWIGMGVQYFIPSSMAKLGLFPVRLFRDFLDPSARDIPIFLPNGESGLFQKVRQFRFEDGGKFDFSGSRDRTLEHRGKTLANSNQRWLKGFRPTYSCKRTFRGLAGRFKLDWFFVKPAADKELAPEFPVTMNELNEVAGTPISDHAPITVDLPLTMPGQGSTARFRR